MQQYTDGLRFILDNGTEQENRTGTNTIMFPTLFMRFDVSEKFPAVTTKELKFKPVKGELCGFLKPVRSAAEFRALGCNIWNQNANENKQWLENPFRKGEDDLGDVYGAMWRCWPAYKFFEYEPSTDIVKKIETDGWVYRGQVGENTSRDADEFKSEGYLWTKEIDLIGECIRKLILEPTNRRILFHAWNPAKLDEMALMPCHLLYQFLPNIAKKELSLSMTQRSADFFLGVPFNIASAALLLNIVARLTGFTPKWLNITFNDAHIYVNHLDQVKEQVTREPYPLPTLAISNEMPTYGSLCKRSFIERPHREADGETRIMLVNQQLSELNPDWFTLKDYQRHPAINGTMAV